MNDGARLLESSLFIFIFYGTQVTVVEFMEQGLVPREDSDISKRLKILKKAGIQSLANTSVEKVEKKNQKKGLIVLRQGQERQ